MRRKEPAFPLQRRDKTGMPDGHEPITVRIVGAIGTIPRAEWDACAGFEGAVGNPFVSHAFLHALEDSGSVGADTGWDPHHLVVEDDAGRIAGAVPLYLKSHSYGEYVFDHGWAVAYERAGGRYYPKLQAAVPFTPVTGPRLLVRPGPGAERIRAALIAAMVELTRRLGISSLHVTFPTARDAKRLAEAGFLIRLGHQYHWHNRGYGSFEDFLAELASRKRKSIRRERRKVAEAGITVRPMSGTELRSWHWDVFYRFYTSTYDRKWGYPYLTREFFEILSATLADRIVLMLAEADGRPIAGAFNLHGGDTLYGRNWGCLAEVPYLHFEACYYSAIDYAIRHGIARVEAGTQGPHKLQRGYEPVQTYSAHWLPDEGFREAVARFLAQERAAERAELRELSEHGPFRRSSDRQPLSRGGAEDTGS